MGPHAIWYFIDTIYASSSSLARLSRSSHHAVAIRKAAFLACFHASLIRSCYDMLITHTRPVPSSSTDPPTAHPPSPTAAPNAPDPDHDPASPASSRPTTPETDSP